MNQDDIMNYFRETLQDDPSKSEAVAAIQTLLELIKLDNAETMVGMRQNLTKAIDILTTSDYSATRTSVNSGCELFLRFITLTVLDDAVSMDFQECRRILVERGTVFLNKVASSRERIGKLTHPFINNGAIILVHARSRVVLHVLKEAMAAKKQFTVYVTESMPDQGGHQMLHDLQEMDIPTVVILDSAVGYIMEKVDFVLVGAEGVVESGGIINRIGTFTTAVCAKAMNKPFYVVAESIKFTRLFPLNQQDIPNQFKFKASKLSNNVDLTKEHPLVDYTPPAYITLMFTDLGVLTPSAVSDQLIDLYR